MRTITYATYSESGGVGKTTLAANLGAAHARAGEEVLLVDLDPQDGSLSYLLGVDGDRADADADSLARHLIGRPRGPFDELVAEAEPGLDVVPAHNDLERLTEWLLRAELEGGWAEADRHRQLRRVLADAGVPDDYSVVIVDPPATSGPHLYNAIDATRSLVVPVERSAKGTQSVAGLEQIVAGLEGDLGIEVGVIAVVPNGVKGTAEQKRAYRERLREELPYPVPVLIGDRESLVHRCWDARCTFFAYGEEHGRIRDYERETLASIETLAEHVVERFRN